MLMIVSRSFLAAPREVGLCGFVGVDVSYGHPGPSFAELVFLRFRLIVRAAG
jgi:hypothetical protein